MTPEMCNGSLAGSFAIAPAAFPALRLLLAEFEAAQAEQCSPWQFASKRRWLLLLGMSDELLEFLEQHCLVERHGRDVVLTEQGRVRLLELNLALPVGWEDDSAVVAHILHVQRDVPVYHDGNRELWFRGHLVKSYAQPAGSQLPVVLAFQEEGWVRIIEDPLSGIDGKDPAQRLHDTINALNRHQKGGRQYIRFGGTGGGTQIYWKPGKDA